MRFLIDENLPRSLARQLRARGSDALDLREMGLAGVTDEKVAAIARAEGRAIITANYHHFGNPLLFPPAEGAGIVVVKMPRCSMRTLVGHLTSFLTTVSPDRLHGALTVVEPHRVRRFRGDLE